MILIDYDTAVDPRFYAKTRDAVIDYVCEHPEVLITVLNGNTGSDPTETKQALRKIQFPVDSVLVNPLPDGITAITYKTMFAAKMQDNPDYNAILVLDADPEASDMWTSLGVGVMAYG